MPHLLQLLEKQQLSRRFALFLLTLLSIISLCFLLLFYFFYHDQITDERTQASQSVSLLLKSSLERAMLRRDLEGLRDIVNDLGQQQDVKEVMILNPAGEIRFASKPEHLGQSGAYVIEQFCPGCSEYELPLQPMTRFVQAGSGDELLRTFHPVNNKSACMTCHGTVTEHPVNGILVVDYDAAPIRAKGQTHMITLAIAGIWVILLSACGAWWFMQRYILKPVHQLGQASQLLSQGDLSARVTLATPPPQDEITELAHTFNHMAERLQQHRQEQQNRQQFLQGLIDTVPDGVRVIDANYRIVLANRTYAEQSGYSGPHELLQKHCYQITCQRTSPCPASLRTCPLHELHQAQQTIKFMETLQRPDGCQMLTEVYATGLPIMSENEQEGFMVVEAVRDLEKAAQYSHEQKLASLGELAAGVAHEIHNPLASVQIALQASGYILDTATGETDALKDYLHLVDEQVKQCLDVTQRLMKLGTLASDYQQLVEVNSVIRETLSLLRFEREQRGIQEHQILDPANPRILAADNDIRMIILNLVQNAFHAMPNQGELTVTTRQLDTQVEIRIQDTGCGIPEQALAHIFDPFFSQRQDKKGSGLGLTIARSLTQQHAGEIRIDAHQAGHTVFVLVFPDADKSLEEAAA